MTTDVALFDLPTLDGVRLTPRSLEVLDPALGFDRFEDLLRAAGEAKTATSFAIGDLLNFGEARYGERYAQAVDATGLSYSTLSNYSYVCRQIAPSRRRENLDRWSKLRFSHFDAVAALEPAAQERWLDRAQENGWNRDQLRTSIQESGELPGKRTTPRQEILPATVESSVVVDAARNLSDVRETLERVGGGLDPETAEAIQIPKALRAVEQVGKTVRALAENPPAGASLVDSARRVVAKATRSSGFAMVPESIFEEFAAAVAATEGGGE